MVLSIFSVCWHSTIHGTNQWALQLCIISLTIVVRFRSQTLRKIMPLLRCSLPAAQKSLHWLHPSPTPQSVPAEMECLSQFSTTHLTKYRANSWIFENASNMVQWTYNEFWQTNKWWPPTNGDPHPQSAWRWPICCAAPMSRALVVSFVLRQDIFKTSPDVKTDMVFALFFWLFTVGIPFGSPLSSLCLARVALRWFFENVRWVAMGPNQFIKILTPMSSKRGQVALSSWLWAAWHCIPRCHQSSDLHAGLTGERPQSPHFRWSTTWTSQRVCCRGMFQLLWSNLRTCSPKVYSRFFAEIVRVPLLPVAPWQWCQPKLSTSTQHRPLCVLIWELHFLDGAALPFPSLDRNFAWIVLDVPGAKFATGWDRSPSHLFNAKKPQHIQRRWKNLTSQQPSSKKTAPFSWELKGLQLTLVWKNDWRIGCNVVTTTSILFTTCCFKLHWPTTLKATWKALYVAFRTSDSAGDEPLASAALVTPQKPNGWKGESVNFKPRLFALWWKTTKQTGRCEPSLGLEMLRVHKFNRLVTKWPKAATVMADFLSCKYSLWACFRTVQFAPLPCARPLRWAASNAIVFVAVKWCLDLKGGWWFLAYNTEAGGKMLHWKMKSALSFKITKTLSPQKPLICWSTLDAGRRPMPHNCDREVVRDGACCRPEC